MFPVPYVCIILYPAGYYNSQNIQTFTILFVQLATAAAGIKKGRLPVLFRYYITALLCLIVPRMFCPVAVISSVVIVSVNEQQASFELQLIA